MKIAKFLAAATAAVAVGWSLACFAYIVVMSRIFKQVPFEEEPWWRDVAAAHKRWKGEGVIGRLEPLPEDWVDTLMKGEG